ncbi:amino acid ABC transporter permease [Agrococcus sp. ARC_14]|uniref:amino acid ABC transporter permease n=1 Tax=Agrococcus sp. ARC_14 TaxID=2919927 RepID=UPI001F05712B|nr:amino acid ABC transporter permease [Agrococcus sp. ARC_14]MCH1881931.1 amino acid ABC transporter permease [Agrococcus sp. ARC_14]
MPIKPRVGIGHWVTVVLAVYIGVVLVELFVFNANWNWDLVFAYLFSQVVLTGLLNTIVLTVLTTALGLVLGVLTAWCRMSDLVVLRTFAVLYIWLMRAMPPLVMLLLVFFWGALVPTFGIGIPFGPSIFEVPTNELVSRFSAAIIGLAIYLGAYSAEIIRGGVLALHSGQFEACKALGLPPVLAYQKILGPQLIRVITPSMANEVITIFKSTSLVSVIGYTELLTTVQTIYARNFETIPLLTVAVIWYLVLTSLAMVGQSQLEKHFGRGYIRRTPAKAKKNQPATATGANNAVL